VYVLILIQGPTSADGDSHVLFDEALKPDLHRVTSYSGKRYITMTGVARAKPDYERLAQASVEQQGGSSARDPAKHP
jgi:hypothetical protein